MLHDDQAFRQVSCHIALGAVAQHRGRRLPNRDRYGNITIRPQLVEAGHLNYAWGAGELRRLLNFAKG
jgi:hypothetical protein